MKPYNIVFVTIVPSPYQRDLFGALNARDDVNLRVLYLEATSPDSPWPIKELREFEEVVPGFWLGLGPARVHVNWGVPEIASADFVVLSSITSVTGQLLMRRSLRNKCWLLWAERLRPHTGWKEMLQRVLVSPTSSSAGVVGIGRAAERDYHSRFPHLPHFSIPYHCDLSVFLENTTTREKVAPITFLFCGQMIARKGVDLLLRAFDRLINDGLDAHLRLVGREASLPQFMMLVGDSTREKIFYEGFQPPEALPVFFKKGDVFVLPSRHDGWGVVVNQAIGAGLPIIASDAVGAALDLIQNDRNGRIIPANDAEALYQSMKDVVLRPELAQKWSDGAHALALTITPEAGAQKWIDVFDCLSDQRMATNGRGARPPKLS